MLPELDRINSIVGEFLLLAKPQVANFKKKSIISLLQDVTHFLDEGCGISEERLTRLGEPFYTTKEKGTGLGLTVSYRIIENHGGTINIQSQAGEGTEVSVILPA
nr:ATP-binding protein [Aneurinibacillus tyrosinisolvens]